MSAEEKQGTLYPDPKQDPNYSNKWEGPNMKEYKDSVYSKISELLLLKWDLIEPYVEGEGFEALQKTYKDGNLVTGRNTDDLLVVYQSDGDANDDDEKMESALFGWLDFGDIAQLTLKLVTTSELSEEGKPSPPHMILMFPDKLDFNLNEIMGTLELTDINLKDNISQFMKIDKVQTNTNRAKLVDNIDAEFSELSPITFTGLLEQYQKFKKDIPFFRYRTDDFFNEYVESTSIPLEYRVEKFFEEFERIKSEIPHGQITAYGNINPTLTNTVTDKELFGWETLIYLHMASTDLLGQSGESQYSVDDVRSWWDTVNELTIYGAMMSGSWDICEKSKNAVINSFSNATGSIGEPVYGCINPVATNYNADATDQEYDGDGVDICTFEEVGVVKGCMDPLALNYNFDAEEDDDTCDYAAVVGCADSLATNYNSNVLQEYDVDGNVLVDNDDGSCEYGPYRVHAVGTGGAAGETAKNRKLYIGGEYTEAYNSTTQGLRLTIISPNSLSKGRWDGTSLHDENYDVYADSSDAKKDAMSAKILDDGWGMDDLFIVTSYNAVAYNPLLIQALKSIGGCNPRLVNGIGSTINSTETMKAGGQFQAGGSTWGAPGDSQTPYVLVGSKGLGECGGWESVTDDGPNTPPAEVDILWDPEQGTEGVVGAGVMPVAGCTDPDARNQDLWANQDDGSCEYDAVEIPEAGCMKSDALNWDVLKNYAYDYCKNPNGFVSQTKCTADSDCTEHGDDWTCNGSCYYTFTLTGKEGCTVPQAWNYDSNAIVDDESCGCFETRKFKDLPPPYDEACQPGIEHPGNQNMNSCTCTYPDIAVTWSRSSSDCTGYNWSNSDAECICRCKDSKNATTEYSHGDIGNCGWGGWSGDDEGSCASHCNTHCANRGTTYVSGRPQCASGEAWNGSFCEMTMKKGGKIQRGRATGMMEGGPIRSTDTDMGINPMLPRLNMGAGKEFWNPDANSDNNPHIPKIHKKTISVITNENMKKGGRVRTTPKPMKRGKK